MVPTSIPSTLLAADNLQIYGHRTWEQFKLIQQGLKAAAGVRLFFLVGTVEVLMPGRDHEIFKKIIASLLEAFLLDHEIEARPTGSMDREVDNVAAAQPDESYEIGEFTLVIEIIVTSGSIAKLELYRALGIDEVWFWQDGVLQLYHLIEGAYQSVDRSHIPALSPLKLSVLTQCILLGETNWNQAIKTFRSAHPL